MTGNSLNKRTNTKKVTLTERQIVEIYQRYIHSKRLLFMISYFEQYDFPDAFNDCLKKQPTSGFPDFRSKYSYECIGKYFLCKRRRRQAKTRKQVIGVRPNTALHFPPRQDTNDAFVSRDKNRKVCWCCSLTRGRRDQGLERRTGILHYFGKK